MYALFDDISGQRSLIAVSESVEKLENVAQSVYGYFQPIVIMDELMDGYPCDCLFIEEVKVV